MPLTPLQWSTLILTHCPYTTLFLSLNTVRHIKIPGRGDQPDPTCVANRDEVEKHWIIPWNENTHAYTDTYVHVDTHLPMRGTEREVSGIFWATRMRKTVWARRTEIDTVSFCPPATTERENRHAKCKMMLLFCNCTGFKSFVGIKLISRMKLVIKRKCFICQTFWSTFRASLKKNKCN